MTELNLQWVEDNRSRSEVITPEYPSKNPGVVRLGRDPGRCDIVLNDGSVSGLHVEIFYDAGRNGFYLRSLRESNPPIINGQSVPSGEFPMGTNSTIQLGRLQLNATLKSAIPPTDVVHPGGVPPTEVGVPPTQFDAATRPQAPPPQPIPSPIPPPPQVAAAPPSPPPYSPPPPASPAALPQQQGGPRIWVWLIAGVLVLSGGALAWPAIQNLIGSGDTNTTSRRESEADRRTRDDDNSRDGQEESSPSFQDRMGDLVKYTHDNNLFTIEVPRSWEREDNSKPKEVIISWTDPDTGSVLVIDLFKTNRSLNNDQLEQITQDFLKKAFKDKPDLKISEAKVLENQFVRVNVEFSTSNGPLIGNTFSRQSKRMVSLASIYVLQSEFDDSEDTVKQILGSYRFFPDAPIP